MISADFMECCKTLFSTFVFNNILHLINLQSLPILKLLRMLQSWIRWFLFVMMYVVYFAYCSFCTSPFQFPLQRYPKKWTHVIHPLIFSKLNMFLLSFRISYPWFPTRNFIFLFSPIHLFQSPIVNLM